MLGLSGVAEGVGDMRSRDLSSEGWGVAKVRICVKFEPSAA